MTLYTQAVSISGAGNHVVVAGDVNFPLIQVISLTFQCNIGTTLTIKAGTTDLTGPMNFTAGGGLNLMSTYFSLFDVDNGDDLVFNLAGLTGQLGGYMVYYQS
jgi:hypothetical protein